MLDKFTILFFINVCQYGGLVRVTGAVEGVDAGLISSEKLLCFSNDGLKWLCTGPSVNPQPQLKHKAFINYKSTSIVIPSLSTSGKLPHEFIKSATGKSVKFVVPICGTDKSKTELPENQLYHDLKKIALLII